MGSLGALRRAALAAFALLLALAGGPVSAAAALFSIIPAVATVSFTIPGTSQVFTNQSSNTVILRIAQGSAFTLTSSQLKFVAPNSVVAFAHTIINTGNGPDTFDIALVNPAASCVTCAFTMITTGVYADMSPADGIRDNTTVVTQTPQLAAGASFTFVAQGTIPGAVTAGQSGAFEVRVQGNAAAATAGAYTAAPQKTNTDTATYSAKAVMQSIGHTLSPNAGPSPGTGNVKIALSYTNVSTFRAYNVTIEDWIGSAIASATAAGGPVLNTTSFEYVAGSARWSICGGGATALTDAAGAAECGVAGQMVDFRFIGAPAAGAPNIVAKIESVPGNTSGVLSFDVKVKAGAPNGIVQTINAARIRYCDDGVAGCAVNQYVDTNQAWYTVSTSTVAGVDLTVVKTVTSPATGGMIVNAAGEFTLQVNNIGTQASTGLVTVEDTLPGGLEVTAMTGIGWTCTQSGVQTAGNATGGGVKVTCTTSIVAPAAFTSTAPGTLQPIKISVTPKLVGGNLGTVAFPALPLSATLTNTASVTGGNEPAANNTNNSGSVTFKVGPTSTVRGRVWQDNNHNRIYNAATDAVLSGWKVEALDASTLAVVKTTITDSSGLYAITALSPGIYLLQFRDPSNNIVNGRPVCNTTGLDSTLQANCEKPAYRDSNAALIGQSTGAVQSVLTGTGRYLQLQLQAGETIVDQGLPLDPSGIVYDSSSGQPVTGAVVTITARNRLTGAALANATGNGNFDIATGWVGSGNTFTTTGNGFYQFLLTVNGQNQCNNAPGGACLFELSVTAPSGFSAWANALAAFPPQASNGGRCVVGVAANCLDTAQPAPAGTPGGAPYLVTATSAAPIPNNANYFLRFVMNGGSPEILNNHFPLIRITSNNLLVSKSASKATAEIGDFVDYTVRVFNGTAASANPVTIRDVLPAGFKYVSGSARLLTPPATVAVPVTPTGGAGPSLIFNGGLITAGTTVTLTYRAQLSVNAALGDGINRASASAAGLGSNTATARVRVTGGVFSDKGFIVGTVFADCNRDRVQGPREPGIPGVRIYMEDGASVVTDAEGKYSMHDISPRTHVMKIDDITLPLGSELIALNNRNAGDPSSRFVDVKKGEMVRADFAEGSCSPDVMKQIKARREKGETGQAELNRAYAGAASGPNGASKPLIGAEGTPVTAPQPLPPGVFRSVAAPGPSGNVNSGSVNSSNSNLPPRQGDATGAQLPDVAQAPHSTQPLEELIVEMDNQLAILNLKDGDTLATAVTSIQLKGTAGTSFSLLVNGVEVPQSRVGKRATLASKSIQAWEYIGVTLKAGANEIIARQTDSFGNLRGEVKLTVLAPGTLGKIVIETVDSATADGVTPVTVKVRLVDDKGTLVTTRTSITLQSSMGRWLVTDLNPQEAGTQVFINGGEGTYQLAAPAEPGDANIDVAGGVLRANKRVAFMPHLRPLIGAGIIEGAINFNSLSLKNLVSTQRRDSFEQEIRRFSYESGDGKRSTDARAALFLKGQVKGDYLLTLAYDSDKDLKERVFRDISPDQFYPIYGDSSARSFDGQSTQRFFVRVDKGRSFVLYGDYATAGPAGARALSQFSRSLTGAKWHLEGAPYQVNTFVSRDTFRQVVSEFAANGTSGPFLLNLPSGSVMNSEKVELITRDRNQPGLILNAEVKGRFADYEIEPFTGRLLFKAPVLSIDANLNPVLIRITYELDQGGTPFWVAGIDGQYKINDQIELGAAVVKDQNPGQEFSMGGLNATWKIFEKTILVAETATTDRKAPAVTTGAATGALVGSGRARRVELRHSDGAFDARLHMGRADVTFDNPSSTLNRGRAEMGARGTYKLTPSTNLSTEFLRTGDVATGAHRDAMQLRADHAFANGIRVEGGVRHSSEKTPATTNGLGVNTSVGTTPNEFTSLSGKVTAPVPGLPQASVNANYEQSIKGDDRKVMGMGAEYKLSASARLYGRFEQISSLSGPNGLNTAQKNTTTVFGLDTKVTESTQVFTEYRGRSAIDGATAEASMGVRNTWAIAEGLRVTNTFERLQPVQRGANSTTSNESTAVTGGIEYTANPLWKGSARLELRNSTATDSQLSTLSLAYKMSREWSLLTRNTWTNTSTKGATPGDQTRWNFQIGAAYRDTDSNKLSALSRFEHREEKDTVAAPALKRALNIASFHANYQPERAWVMSARYAAKFVEEDSLGIASKSSGHLISGRITHDLTSKWDIGLVASLHGDGGFGNRKMGLGLEAGYLLQENLWLSAGFNFFGFKDKDLAGADFTDKGFYLRLRYKFDESLFDWNKDAKLRQGDAAGKPSGKP